MRRLIQASAGVMVAAALAFGGTQALAAPTAPAATPRAACTSSTCGTKCFQLGYTHWACWNGNCQCSYGPPP
jgi:hypothetical protein